jgi:membrane-bound lytic murein transglycosylase B
VSAGLVAVLAAALVAGPHAPAHDVLADATVATGGPVTAPVVRSAVSTVPPVQLPDPTGHAVHAPASTGRLRATGVVDVQGIPPVALMAYQRAAAVIDAADPSCRLDWSVLAAIGQVESDNGQVGGSRLDSHGVAHPAIIGPRLDGRPGTARVRDTDAGRLDGDRRFDHAVGPMQFLPSTWAAVAVDGDDDGHRNVQDIDDASLGAAVYLCAGHEDLSTRSGRHTALLRYNHSRSYAALVLAIARQLRTSHVLPTEQVNVRTVALRLLPAVAPGRVADHDGGRPPGHTVHVAGDAHTTRTTRPTGPLGPVIVDPTPPATDPTPPSDPTPSDPTPSDPTQPSDPPQPTPSSDPGDPSTPPAEAPVLTDPLPAELSGLTDQQVSAYDQAWAACDDDLPAGWSADASAVTGLTQCLAAHLAVAADDDQITAFVTWLGRTQGDPTG